MRPTKLFRLVDQDGNSYDPPRIYEIMSDTFRLATQEDVDLLCEVRAAYDKLLRAVRDGHERLSNSAKVPAPAGGLCGAKQQMTMSEFRDSMTIGEYENWLANRKDNQ